MKYLFSQIFLFIFIQILFLTVIFNSQCLARTIVIEAPLASDIQYKEYLNAHSEAKSFSSYIENKIQNNHTQESQLFKLGDIFFQNLTETIQALKNIESEAPLTLTSLRYIQDLSEKALLEKTSPQEKQQLLYFYCKSSLLLNEGPVLHPCSNQSATLLLLKKYYPQLRRILIETIPFSTENKETLLIATQTTYHWTLLSNSHAPIHFFGTFQQLLNQQFQFEPLINGSCDEFSHQNLDFEVVNEGVVFFSDICQKRIKPIDEKKSWISENKNFLFIAGGILATGLIYNYAKGKKFIIDTTALK
ncbi:MAG: hypothetical protein ACXVCY_16455 [Pseudobdellovibrionaceae bacterium]